MLLGVLRGPWITPPLIFLQAAFAAAFYPAGFSLLSSAFPLPIRNVAVSMVLIFGSPPLVGFLADRVSFAFAFGAAGVATLASLLFLGMFSSPGSARGADDGKPRSTSR